jgi:hypothetical protein
MRLHGNAALSLNGRRRLVGMVIEQGRSIATAAEAAGVSERTCSKWVARYRAHGGLAAGTLRGGGSERGFGREGWGARVWTVAYLCRVSSVKRAAGVLVVSGCASWSVVHRARGRPGLSRCST